MSWERINAYARFVLALRAEYDISTDPERMEEIERTMSRYNLKIKEAFQR